MQKKSFTVTGLKCAECVKTVKEKLETLDAITEVNVTLDPPRAELTSEAELDIGELNRFLSSKGKYELKEI